MLDARATLSGEVAVRIWRWIWLMSVASCAPAQAGIVNATFGVSARVLEQCTIQASARSANCSAGSGYQLVVAREKLPSGGRLTGDAEPAQLLSSDVLPSGSGVAEWGNSLVSVDRAAGSTDAGALVREVRRGLSSDDRGEAVRITFSF